MNKLIKAVILPKYSAELYETPQGYYVLQTTTGYSYFNISFETKDLKLALLLFDQKIQELEGQ